MTGQVIEITEASCIDYCKGLSLKQEVNPEALGKQMWQAVTLVFEIAAEYNLLPGDINASNLLQTPSFQAALERLNALPNDINGELRGEDLNSALGLFFRFLLDKRNEVFQLQGGAHYNQDKLLTISRELTKLYQPKPKPEPKPRHRPIPAAADASSSPPPPAATTTIQNKGGEQGDWCCGLGWFWQHKAMPFFHSLMYADKEKPTDSSKPKME